VILYQFAESIKKSEHIALQSNSSNTFYQSSIVKILLSFQHWYLLALLYLTHMHLNNYHKPQIDLATQ